MANIDSDPFPRVVPRDYQRSDLPRQQEEVLPPPMTLKVALNEVLSRRRSASHFGVIRRSDLSTWLRYTCGVQAYGRRDSNRQRRFVGSFGALHPSHVLIGDSDGSWSTYIPEQHSLGRVRVDPEVGERLRAKAEDCHPGEEATLVALVADLDLAESYYLRPPDLLLRDGGVLLGHGAIVAAAIGIPFRILGIVGSGVIETLLPDAPFTCYGTGLAWIGGVPRTDPDQSEDSSLGHGQQYGD